MFQNATLDPFFPGFSPMLQLVYLQVVSSISSQMAQSLHAHTGSETRRPPGAFLPGLRQSRSCMRPTLRLENPIDTPRTLAARRSPASFPGAGGFGWLLAVLGCLTGPGSGAGAAAGAEPLLEGRVLLSSGAPAAGARVRLFAELGRSLGATADESGYFALPLTALRKAAPCRRACAWVRTTPTRSIPRRSFRISCRRQRGCAWRCSTSWVSGWRPWWTGNGRPVFTRRPGTRPTLRGEAWARGCICTGFLGAGSV